MFRHMRISLYLYAFQIVKMFLGRNERLYALPQPREDCNQPNIVRDGLIYILLLFRSSDKQINVARQLSE